MALFGLNKSQVQALIDASVKAEANIRDAADVAETGVRSLADAHLSQRIAALENPTPQPVPVPTPVPVPPPPVPVPTPPPPPVPVPVPSPTASLNVPADGTLAQCIAKAKAGDVIQVNGVVDAGFGKLCEVANLDNGTGFVTILGAPGSLLKGYSGLEFYGSCRGWILQNLNVQVNGGNIYGTGIYFAGDRTDFGGNGQGAAGIQILNCTVDVIPGTGPGVQRDGIAVWGAADVLIDSCTVKHCATNAWMGPDSAGSGISLGFSIATTRPYRVANIAFEVSNCVIAEMIGYQDGDAYDRNGINLDGIHQNSNYAKGDVSLHDNHITDVWGRGIQMRIAGMADAKVDVMRNTIDGQYADHLAGSNPICGLGGYGNGQCGYVTVDSNTVIPYGGRNAYEFDNFDGPGPGVQGTGNTGTPVVFNASPTNNVPAGFSA